MEQPDALERQILLCRVLSALGGIRGRKRLQKSFYIAKALGYPVQEPYIWGNYGVYSSELQWEIDGMVKAELIEETNISLPSEDPEYNYTVTDKGRTLLNEINDQVAKSESDELFSIEKPEMVPFAGNNEVHALLAFLRRLGESSVRELELWSSILYLRQSEKNEGTLIAFLHYLKPQYSEEDIRNGIVLVDELVAKNTLQFVKDTAGVAR